VEQNCTKKKPSKCCKFKCNTISLSFLACRCSSVILSSKVGREKKKSVETGLCMGICSCGLPARCCQPAVAGDVIYADLWGELNTPLALQALFTQSSPVCELLLQAFPSPSTGVGDTTPAFSSHGNWVSPPLLCSFPPTATFTSFPAPVCWACAAPPASWCVVYRLHGEWVFPSSCVVLLPP
jgi:hypothetical protein